MPPPPIILKRLENLLGVFGTSSTGTAVIYCGFTVAVAVGISFLIFKTLLGNILVVVYCLFGSTVMDYLMINLSLLTFFAVLTSSSTTPLIDLTIVENSLYEATLLNQTVDTIKRLRKR
jgi:hypothetical protein